MFQGLLFDDIDLAIETVRLVVFGRLDLCFGQRIRQRIQIGGEFLGSTTTFRGLLRVLLDLGDETGMLDGTLVFLGGAKVIGQQGTSIRFGDGGDYPSPGLQLGTNGRLFHFDFITPEQPIALCVSFSLSLSFSVPPEQSASFKAPLVRYTGPESTEEKKITSGKARNSARALRRASPDAG